MWKQHHISERESWKWYGSSHDLMMKLTATNGWTFK